LENSTTFLAAPAESGKVSAAKGACLASSYPRGNAGFDMTPCMYPSRAARLHKHNKHYVRNRTDIRWPFF
jgi:hypothetical protein